MLRFLSHAEILRVFRRACIRAGIKIKYTEGFNPRPKMSLPLPKSVGIEIDNDILCLWYERDTASLYGDMDGNKIEDYCLHIKAKLSDQLPKGIELLSVRFVETNKPFQPRLASYEFNILPEYFNELFKVRIKHLLTRESLMVTRTLETSRRRIKRSFKTVDVRPFLKSIELGDNWILVACKICSAGSIRIDEILRLLELDAEKLAGPVKRTSVEWQVGES